MLLNFKIMFPKLMPIIKLSFFQSDDLVCIFPLWVGLSSFYIFFCNLGYCTLLEMSLALQGVGRSTRTSLRWTGLLPSTSAETSYGQWPHNQENECGHHGHLQTLSPALKSPTNDWRPHDLPKPGADTCFVRPAPSLRVQSTSNCLKFTHT